MEKATFTVEETAGYLGIGRNKAYELVSLGIIPHLKLGKQIRIPKVSLDEWITAEALKQAQ